MWAVWQFHFPVGEFAELRVSNSYLIVAHLFRLNSHVSCLSVIVITKTGTWVISPKFRVSSLHSIQLRNHLP